MWLSVIKQRKNSFSTCYVMSIVLHVFILLIWDILIHTEADFMDSLVEFKIIKRKCIKWDPSIEFRRREIEITNEDIIEKMKKEKRKKKRKKKELEPILIEFKKKYIDLVFEKVEENKFYPEIEKQRGHQGEVYVRFIIIKNGDIKDLQIVKKNSFKYLNQAAIETIKSSVPFPILPRHLDELAVLINIEFKLK